MSVGLSNDKCSIRRLTISPLYGWHWYKANEYEGASDADDERDEEETTTFGCNIAARDRSPGSPSPPSQEHILPLTLEEPVGEDLIIIDRTGENVTSPDVSDIESLNCEEDLEDKAEEEDESENVTSPDVSDIKSLGDDIFVEDDVQGARALTPPDMPELVCWVDNAYGFAAQALGRSITPPDLFSWVDNGEGRAMRGSGRSTTPPDMPELVLAGNDYGHAARTLGRSRTPPGLMMPDNDGWVPFLRRQELLPELQHFEKVIGVLLKIKLRGKTMIQPIIA
ncbi:uncharacterized protein LOC127286097 [Leptopilina boulardi]|uniref:uncharacterized protein LOC127286097 n=1 Tax=Leptopilina boulardi TaxID=63433 RepID=UPI0021F5C434|nr:uncharacterized protein LOC127286097 [Leptopilina boulardi]